MAKSLGRRRVEAGLAITAAALSTGGGSGAPTPSLELPKQLAIAGADLAMLAAVYRIYFDENPTEESVEALLQEYGLATVAGGALVYGGMKLTEGLMAEALNFIPLAGWGISALITGSVTGMVGLSWAAVCDGHYQLGTRMTLADTEAAPQTA